MSNVTRRTTDVINHAPREVYLESGVMIGHIQPRLVSGYVRPVTRWEARNLDGDERVLESQPAAVEWLQASLEVGEVPF
jgi:hypothetical protein